MTPPRGVTPMFRLPVPRVPVLRPLAAALAAGLIAVTASAATPERETELMSIAASCAAFYQAGFDRLGLPVERNEAPRQAFIRAAARSAKRSMGEWVVSTGRARGTQCNLIKQKQT